MALRKASEIVPEVMENVPTPIDEEGITTHSTDEDEPPQIGRVTVEPVDTDLMMSDLVKKLGDITKAIDKLR
jgi:hypothetical protein